MTTGKIMENDPGLGSIGGSGGRGATGGARDQAAGRRGEGGQRARGKAPADASEGRTKAKDIAGRMEETRFKLMLYRYAHGGKWMAY